MKEREEKGEAERREKEKRRTDERQREKQREFTVWLESKREQGERNRRGSERIDRKSRRKGRRKRERKTEERRIRKGEKSTGRMRGKGYRFLPFKLSWPTLEKVVSVKHLGNELGKIERKSSGQAFFRPLTMR